VICPLVFSFHDAVIGNGFIAHVVAHGRAILMRDGGGREIWMYGVEPGGIAGGARSQHEAMREFKKSYLSVLFDIAIEAKSFEKFAVKVRRFFAEASDANEEFWRFGIRSLRAGNSTHAVKDRTHADQWVCGIEIVRVDNDASAERNKLDEIKSVT
jgi:hypothetical protein